MTLQNVCIFYYIAEFCFNIHSLKMVNTQMKRGRAFAKKLLAQRKMAQRACKIKRMSTPTKPSFTVKLNIFWKETYAFKKT